MSISRSVRPNLRMRLLAVAHDIRTRRRASIAEYESRPSCAHDRNRECERCYFDRVGDSAW